MFLGLLLSASRRLPQVLASVGGVGGAHLLEQLGGAEEQLADALARGRADGEHAAVRRELFHALRDLREPRQRLGVVELVEHDDLRHRGELRVEGEELLAEPGVAPLDLRRLLGAVQEVQQQAAAPDVPQERVPQPAAVRGAVHQPGNVRDDDGAQGLG
eukprot:CAMPEP_0118866878 /NCGR_PEP_ID=MMETSP1163-20130328/10658_1 /TAXON_ID=124430 /ORGANISM="Phaeomonas parva, Strain CCMP2877" /LENGTH=158 /DNA_ID=CAMNT_0006801237 /DNA_START=63 /DNA_END=535 /DNA_ORIENTATION=-